MVHIVPSYKPGTNKKDFVKPSVLAVHQSTIKLTRHDI